jgi:predicted RNA-binding Zn-ribbon protein involved in translation (DUF1610 family)
MVLRIACGPAEGFHDRWGSGEVRVPHPEIDHINTACPFCGLELIDSCKEVRGKLSHTFRVHSGSYTLRIHIKVTCRRKINRRSKISRT